MKLTDLSSLFREPAAYAGQEITVCGWVRNRRDSKVFGFIMLNDGSFFESLQVVYDNTLPNFNEISHINIGAALIVKGIVELTPAARQPFELKATEITVEGLTGTITWTADGEPDKDPKAVVIQDGVYVSMQ